MTRVAELLAKLREQDAEIERLREAARIRVWMEQIDDVTPDSALLVTGEPTRVVRLLRWLGGHLGFSWEGLDAQV
jgi:hypothetical protein